MKEITTELTMRVTMISNHADSFADQMILDNREIEERRKMANKIKEILGADDVQITGIKDFVRDIEEE